MYLRLAFWTLSLAYTAALFSRTAPGSSVGTMVAAAVLGAALGFSLGGMLDQSAHPQAKLNLAFAFANFSENLLLGNLLFQSPARSEFKYSARDPSEIRVLGPFAPARFDAINDSSQKHNHTHPHPGEPKYRHQKIELRWKRASPTRSEGDGQNENSEGQYQACYHGEHINGLQQKRLQCVKRNKFRISFNQEDRQRSDPPKQDLQHLGQERDGALILGRLRRCRD